MIIVVLFMAIMLTMLTVLNMLTMLNRLNMLTMLNRLNMLTMLNMQFFMVIMASTSDQADSQLDQSESLPSILPPHFPYLYFLIEIFVNQ